jgi:hypothetical protein
MAISVTRLIGATAVVASMAGAAGCGTPQTIPTPVAKTETFSGTVAKGGTSDNTFPVAYELALTSARVTVTTLTSAATGAPLSVTIGVAVGSLNTGVCVPHPNSNQAAAVVGQPLETPPSFLQGPSNYCVRVYDNGTLTDSANYTVTVLHY